MTRARFVAAVLTDATWYVTPDQQGVRARPVGGPAAGAGVFTEPQPGTRQHPELQAGAEEHGELVLRPAAGLPHVRVHPPPSRPPPVSLYTLMLLQVRVAPDDVVRRNAPHPPQHWGRGSEPGRHPLLAVLQVVTVSWGEAVPLAGERYSYSLPPLRVYTPADVSATWKCEPSTRI